MEKEKLNSYLSKVVTFMQPVGAQVKGFLYHDNDGYYIKTIEILRGGNSVGDIIRLKSEDIEHLSHASKPSLMIVDMKSWHYKLMKYVLDDSCPTPKTMQNGCPYFWLLLFSIVVVPFVVIGSGIKFMLNEIVEATDGYIQRNVDSFLKNLETVDEFYDVYDNKVNRPFLVKKYYKNHYGEDLMEKYIKIKHGVEPTDTSYTKIRTDIKRKYNDYLMNLSKKREEAQNEARKRRHAETVRIERRKEVFDNFFNPINKWFNGIFLAISDAIHKMKELKNIIRITKNFFGAIITLILLGMSYIFSSLIIYVIIGVIDLIYNNWETTLIVLMFFGIVVAAGVIIKLTQIWTSNIVAKYRRGKKVWYAELLINIFYKPIRLIGIGVVAAVKHVIVLPIIFIFYTFLYRFVLISSFKIFIGTLKGSTGILGEYMGASFTDFCPGLGWVNDPENENIKE